MAPHTPKPRDFVERRTLPGVIAVARDLLLIGSAIALSVWIDHWAFYIVTVWFIGLVQLALGEVLTHEASHYNLFKPRWMNRWGELVYCLPFFFTLDDYRQQHREHHEILNNDLEQLEADYRQFGLYEENVNWFVLWFVKPICGYGALFFLMVVKDMAGRKLSSWLKIIAFWTVVIAAATLTGSLELLVAYWIVPLLWCYGSFFYWSEIEDHFNTKSGTRTNIGWLNWITHNNGYHYVHHLYETIPWYNLRRAHWALTPDHPDISTGFFDTYRQLKSGKYI